MPRRLTPVPLRVLQLKVSLLEMKPPVWRRLLVPDDITLARLHDVLQTAMGWTDSHLHVFRLRDRRFGDLRQFEGEDPALEDERKVRLGQLVGVRQTLEYEYDFGDGWTHALRVEQVLEPDPRLPYPLCTGGARACPPEDCGGPPGYERLLEALDDPAHEDHEQLLEWIGGYFDPKGFDANGVNRELRAQR